MKTKFLICVLVSLVVISIVSASMLIPLDDKAKERSKADNAPVIEKVDEHLVLKTPGLEKIVYIHYEKDFAKPPWAGGGKKPKEAKCYGFLGRGVSWKDSVSYVVHPDLETAVPGAIFASAEAWDVATSQKLFSDNYDLDKTADWDNDAPDGRNEFSFGDYPQSDVIAVAIVWGYFSGPPQTREIIEFDILFDTDFTWGDAAINPEVMDLQSIATHEIGHGVGLDDIYDTACSDVTMYGYSDEGETKKRTLEQPDITGLLELYY